MNKNAGNTVRLSLDSQNVPPLSAQQRAELDALAAMPDAAIDYSDAPHRPDAPWMRAATQLPHTKRQITLRIDAEVLEFFKRTGKRYQSRMNAVLRAYVEAQKAHAK
ncbi:MAG: BrnA antitoxin family protein [Rhodocyclaceae bacterium]|nr:BrnA antitoxin family protein [Rhodocyclaceae bacterium]